MVFGWFSGKGEGEDKRLAKARKLQSQDRCAEALSYFEELVGQGEALQEATAGARACRERLVAVNLEEARAYLNSDLDKAREHARLALDLAGDEADLRAQAEEVLESARARPAPPNPEPDEPRDRLFEPSYSPDAPNGADDLEEERAEEEEEEEGEEEEEIQVDAEDLFALYLETADPEEREALEPLGRAFREGYVLLHQGDIARAREKLAQAAAEEPRLAAISYTMALLEAVEGNPEEAERLFSEALETDPEFAPAARHRADVLRERGKPDEAAALLEEWLRAHPADGEAHLLLAGCLLERGDSPGAQREAEEAGRGLSPEDVRPSLLAARALRRSGDRSAALQALQGVLARRPDLLEALVPTGELLLEEGGVSAERAAEVFKRCYQLDPERAWWYLLRVAGAYGARGWKAQAREMLEHAREELPDAPEARDAWQAVADRLS